MNKKETIIDFILCLTLGYLGVHKFYKKKNRLGVLYLFTFGLFGIGWIYDTIMLLLKLTKNETSNTQNNNINPSISNYSHNIAQQLEEQKAEIQKIKEHNYQYYIDTLNNLKFIDLHLSELPTSKNSIKDIVNFKITNVTNKISDLKLDNFVVIDTETTGLNATQNEILEIAAIKFEDGNPTECLTTLIHPKKPISIEITKINNITNEMVSNAPSVEFVMEAFNEFINGYNIVAYNTEFDIKFLHKNGMDFFSQKRYFYDALQLCKKIFSSDYISNYKLDTICKTLGIQRKQSHRALEDALATGIIFRDLGHQLKGQEVSLN